MKKPRQQPARILFHNSYPGLGGSQKIAWQLLSGLPPERFEAWAGAPFENEFLRGCGLPPGRRLDFELPAGFRTFRGGLLRRNPLWLIGQILTRLLPFWWRAWRRLRRARIDLVYVSNERCLFFVGPPARLAGIPVLWHLQSGFRLGRPWVHRLASHLATHAAAVSEAVRSDARICINKRLGARIRLIYNGLPDVTVPVRDVGKQKNDTFTIVFIGALTPEKGLHILLKAVQNRFETNGKKLIVKIAGTFRDDWYEAFVRSLMHPSQAELTGFCADVPALLSQADVLVAPSIEAEKFALPDDSVRTVAWKEGFHLVALEGLWAGVPVIASASYGLKEVVEDNVSGLLFAPGDSEDLWAKIVLLADDKLLQKRLSKAGRQRYEQFFTEEKMRGQFIHLLEELTS